MSANININELTGQAAFFSANGKPAWHQLGQVLDSPLTAKEAIKEAQLDYYVAKVPLYLPNSQQAENVFATMRMDTQQQLGVVGNRYEVVQNKDAFKFFDPIVDRNEAIYETGGALGNGEKVWIMAKLPDHFYVPGTSSDDTIETYIVLFNTHDASYPVTAFTTDVRVVCNNTLMFALRGATNKVTIRHTASAEESLKEAHKILGITNKLNEELTDIWAEMARTEVNDKMIESYLDTILPIPESSEEEEKKRNAPKIKRFRTEVIESFVAGAGQDMPGVRNTVYGLYNGTTYWLDHVKNYRNGIDGRLKGIWIGSGADLRQKSFDTLKEYVLQD